MARDLRFLPAIPEGMRIFAGDVEVAGVQHRISSAKQFLNGHQQDIHLEREPGNKHDPNAIRAVGTFKGWFFNHKAHVGYVPADLAKVIADSNMFTQIRPRLRNIWYGGRVRDFIVIRFDILEPKPVREPRSKKKLAK